jgi:nucleoside-diphosphate-sugar epimerase
VNKSFTLIAGASGFLGSNLLKILKKKKLICLYNSRKIQNKNIISIKFDIKNRNYSFLRKYRISTLVHFLWPNMSNLQHKNFF